MATTFDNKASILADLWLNYRQDPDFIDFIEYHDLGLPLAYVVATGIVETTELATRFIDETFDLLVAGLEIEDSDEGYESLEQLFDETADN